MLFSQEIYFQLQFLRGRWMQIQQILGYFFMKSMSITVHFFHHWIRHYVLVSCCMWPSTLIRTDSFKFHLQTCFRLSAIFSALLQVKFKNICCDMYRWSYTRITFIIHNTDMNAIKNCVMVLENSLIWLWSHLQTLFLISVSSLNCCLYNLSFSRPRG
jgi:hypothetical protein